METPNLQGLPNEDFFRNVLNRAKCTPQPILNDTTLGINVGYSQLFTDVLRTREALWERIPSSLLDSQGILLESRPFIGLHTSPNYEFYVATLAILAIGGAIVPLRPEFHLDDTLRLLQKCEASCLVLGAQQMPLTDEIKSSAARLEHPLEVVPVMVKSVAPADPSALSLSIDEQTVIPDHRPSLLIHTTGTSGPPKSVIHLRRLFNHKFPPSSPTDLILIYESLDWISANITILVRVLTGSQGEIISTYPGPAAIWARLRQGGITSVAGVAHFWEQLGKYFLDHLDNLPATEREEYVTGAHTVARPYIAGAAPAPWLLPFWRKTFGRDIQVGYVATELGVITMMTSPNAEQFIERCLGKPLPGITAKLSQGDHGEIRIKTPFMMSHYLNNPAATQAAFNEEGFFKTGDAGHREGDQYVFDGRIGADFLELDTGSISMLNLDMQLIKQPYISEVYGIPLERGNELGLLVRFQKPDESEDILLERLRTDTAAVLGPHEVNLNIRVLHDDDTVPRTFNRKIWRRKAIDPFFPART